MDSNPLVPLIRRHLRNSPEGLSEYQLLILLELDGLRLDQEPGITAELLLFRKHFLVMNALYRLQPLLWDDGYYLSISALKIELQPMTTHVTETLPCRAGDQALRDYYLDWSQFERSSSASVEQLLSTFWQRYLAEDKKWEALAVLQLDSGCSWSEIRTAYRRLVALNHPDRGGEGHRFRRVREAYELLACCQS